MSTNTRTRVNVRLLIMPPEVASDVLGILGRAADGLRFLHRFIDEMAGIDEDAPDFEDQVAAAVNRLYDLMIAAYPTSDILRADSVSMSSVSGGKVTGH